MNASLLYKSNCYLAEGPMWHNERESFFWVDIDGKAFHEYKLQSGDVRRWQLYHRISLVVESKDGRLILGMENGIAAFNLQTETMEWLVDLERNILTNRSNDGACDAAGRLWIGTMAKDFAPAAGSLYCIDANFSVTKKLEKQTIPNGLVWSLDNKRMYFIDTPTQCVRSFLFDVESGNIQFEKVVIEIDKQNGSPDGMAIDEEGMLWIAQWNGFGVYRWDPLKGRLLDKITLPVPQVSSCVFGGDKLNYLFITTARENMKDADLQKYPDSGNVFIAETKVKGVPAFKFG
ncbi:MAG TPA: SMP-30/gluconolactonase/LRE family protein [Chitinophagaceae bacterium]|jgi:sugar lactone lactonase YvrE